MQFDLAVQLQAFAYQYAIVVASELGNVKGLNVGRYHQEKKSHYICIGQISTAAFYVWV